VSVAQRTELERLFSPSGVVGATLRADSPVLVSRITAAMPDGSMDTGVGSSGASVTSVGSPSAGARCGAGVRLAASDAVQRRWTANSATDGNRSRLFLARARKTTFSTSGGSSGRYARAGTGVECTTWYAIDASVSPENAGRPVSIS